MARYEIPFNKPYLSGRELDYIAQAIDQGHASGDGPFTNKCQALLEAELGAHHVLLTSSCTHALEMAALLLRLKPGDEVIIPAFTFVSTANAFVLRHVKPVFADVRPDTLNMDETLLEGLVTARTKAIVVVHYGGVACEMDTILALAAKRDLLVVEDNAHGLFAKYRGRYLGTFGALAAQSFHETKNISCGEGGALIVNDSKYTARAEIIRDKGTDRQQFYRGQVDKYSWVDLGSSYAPSELQAAYLFAQLENWRDIQTKRKRIWSAYDEGLKSWAESEGVAVQHVPTHVDPSYHLYPLIMPSQTQRDGLIAHLKERSILSVFHYQPLNQSKMGYRSAGRQACPVTEDLSGRLLRLPFYNGLTKDDQARVVDAVTDFS